MKINELKSICENLIDTFNVAGKESIDLFASGLKIEIKEDKSPVSNGDLKVNELITKKINELTPNIPIVSEETVDLNVKNTAKIFWLIDPIDGTKEYIAGKDEYTLNAALVVNTVPVLGLVGVPKKNRLFYSYAPGESYLVENGKIKQPLKGATLIGNGPDAMSKISMIGNDLALDDGIGTCGKDGQGVPVGVGQPTLLMGGITIGGTDTN